MIGRRFVRRLPNGTTMWTTREGARRMQAQARFQGHVDVVYMHPNGRPLTPAEISVAGLDGPTGAKFFGVPARRKRRPRLHDIDDLYAQSQVTDPPEPEDQPEAPDELAQRFGVDGEEE